MLKDAFPRGFFPRGNAFFLVAFVRHTKFLSHETHGEHGIILGVYLRTHANFTDFVMEDSRPGCPFFIFSSDY